MVVELIGLENTLYSSASSLLIGTLQSHHLVKDSVILSVSYRLWLLIDYSEVSLRQVRSTVLCTVTVVSGTWINGCVTGSAKQKGGGNDRNLKVF